MSRSGAIDLVWGDGEHRFRLAIGQLEELEQITKIGPFELFEKMLRKQWRVGEVRHVIRIGLIGGGMGPADAVALVDRYISEWPWTESVGVALHILTAALVGSEADPAGKAEAGDEDTAGASPASSGTAQRAASRRRKSTK